MLVVHAQSPKLHRVLAEQVPRVGRLKRLVEDLEVHAATMVRAYLEGRRDKLRVADLDIAVLVVARTVESLTHAAVLEHSELLRDDRLPDSIADMILRYLAA